MNVERLHAIVEALKAEISDTNYPELLDQLVNGLREAVESPAQAGPQETISQAREGLNTALRDAPSNNFSPAWQQALEEMGVADLFGEALLEDLEGILSTNEITPSTAANDIAQIQERVQGLVRALDQASSALTFFQIGSEELTPGEFEIGFLIPRREVSDGLEELGKEFVHLKRIIVPFSELANEGRPEIRVRSISSSEFQVFLESAPATAVLFTLALERVLRVYQQILDIRIKHQELAENSDVPDDALKPLSEHASEKMAAEIRAITENVISEASLADEGRLNELRNELTRQLNALAERIDRGFDVEVRAGEIPESTDDEIDEDEVDQATRKATKTVLDAQKDLEFMNVSGKPILSLEQPIEDPAGESEGSAGEDLA